MIIRTVAWEKAHLEKFVSVHSCKMSYDYDGYKIQYECHGAKPLKFKEDFYAHMRELNQK